MDEEKFRCWFVKAIPWVGCPFDLQLVIGTKDGKEDAIKVFRQFYQNENLEISDCHEISLIRADMFYESIAKEKNGLN